MIDLSQKYHLIYAELHKFNCSIFKILLALVWIFIQMSLVFQE